jgi:membrane protease YdiL (CAAX protease family)
MKEQHLNFPSIVEAFFLIVMWYGALYLLAAMLHDSGILAGLDELQTGAIVEVLGGGVVFTAVLHYKQLGYRALLHSGSQPVATLLGRLGLPVIMLVPALQCVTMALHSLLLAFAPMSDAQSATFERLASDGPSSFILVCLLAPVLEEMLFRGVILRSFLHQYSRRTAIVASALLFGLAHMNVYQLVVGAVIGYALGWLYARSRSVLPGILLHAAFNFCSMNMSVEFREQILGSALGWLLAFMLAAAGVALILRALPGDSHAQGAGMARRE